MDEYRMSQALGNVSDDLLLEAAQITKKRTNRTVKILRVAAIAAAVAILITALAFWPVDDGIVKGPGLLSVVVHAADSEGGEVEIKELDTRDFFHDRTKVSTFSNYYPGIPLLLSVELEDYPTEEITFEVAVSNGVYTTAGPEWVYSSVVTVRNNTEIYWDYVPWEYDSGKRNEAFFNSDFDSVFTKITIFCEGNIIGYAVFCFDRIYSDEIDGPYYDKINGNMPLDLFWLQLVASASFPKVDGEYQNITQEYVNECIAKANLL